MERDKEETAIRKRVEPICGHTAWPDQEVQPLREVVSITADGVNCRPHRYHSKLNGSCKCSGICGGATIKR